MQIEKQSENPSGRGAEEPRAELHRIKLKKDELEKKFLVRKPEKWCRFALGTSSSSYITVGENHFEKSHFENFKTVMQKIRFAMKSIWARKFRYFQKDFQTPCYERWENWSQFFSAKLFAWQKLIFQFSYGFPPCTFQEYFSTIHNELLTPVLGRCRMPLVIMLGRPMNLWCNLRFPTYPWQETKNVMKISVDCFMSTQINQDTRLLYYIELCFWSWFKGVCAKLCDEYISDDTTNYIDKEGYRQISPRKN